MRTVGLIVVAVVAVFVVSCSRKPRGDGHVENSPANPGAALSRPSVVGKWLTPTGGSIEFKSGGSATMAGPAGSREVRYRLPDERTIEISKPGGTTTIRWQIVLLGAHELVVKDSDGMEVRFRRSG